MIVNALVLIFGFLVFTGGLNNLKRSEKDPVEKKISTITTVVGAVIMVVGSVLFFL